tara:strand:+ start:63 stop:314 length:252 start_codon:yes stop_codon:yes gene_type:complete
MKISRHQLRKIIAEHLMQERRMETDVMRIVTRAINHGPKTHQELLANVLDEFPNTADEEIDTYIDNLEDSGDIIFDPRIQKYY